MARSNQMDGRSAWMPVSGTQMVEKCTCGIANPSKKTAGNRRRARNQEWIYTPATKQFKARHGKCLGGVNTNGREVYMWDCNTGSANQRWLYWQAGLLSYQRTCTSCGCSGSVNVDYKWMGHGIRSAEDCFQAMVADTWCGNQNFVWKSGQGGTAISDTAHSHNRPYCYCRATSSPCGTPISSWLEVYTAQAGLLPYWRTCTSCGCPGRQNVDYKWLGNGMSSAEQCFQAMGADSWCGNQYFVYKNGQCYCRAQSSPCGTPTSGGLEVYQAGR